MIADYITPAPAISIHAAREGGDQPAFATEDFGRYISIHAAREGGDHRVCSAISYAVQFQSTPPVKAATFPRRPTQE